jgi:hypothetical protein
MIEKSFFVQGVQGVQGDKCFEYPSKKTNDGYLSKYIVQLCPPCTCQFYCFPISNLGKLVQPKLSYSVLGG